MRLLRVETTRFRSRRAVVLILVGTALLAALLAFSAVWDTRPVSAGDLAAAQARAEAEAAKPHVREEVARCQEHPRQYFGPGADAATCEEVLVPQAGWFLDRAPLSLEQERDDRGLAVIMLVLAAAVVVGTTFAGADWATGSMSNQLLFEPRRLRVWGAKAGAVLLGVLVAGTVIVAGFWLTLYLTAEARGIPTGATVQESIRAMAGRGILLAGLAALGAYALTMLLRHTVGTLALLFGYAVGGEALTAALPVEQAGRWTLPNNVFAWLLDGTEVYDPGLVCTSGACNPYFTVTLAQGATYLGVLLAMVAVLSVASFRHRDVP